MKSNSQNLLTDDLETIVAQCTPRGSGAIALIRISGQQALSVANSIAKLSSGKSLESRDSHTIHHGSIIDPDNPHEIIDEVLFFLMKGPRTFTGQDTVEISCHNNQFIIENIISCAIKYGARTAQPGEFTKRSFLNNKIDLLQAEAINDILGAQTELALKKSLAQLQGSLSSFMHHLEAELFKLLSLIESSFEFLEEEQRDLEFEKIIHDKTDEVLSELKVIKANFNNQQHIKQGIRIALIGSVNAGKSTLFNALVKQERAIVADIEGTTRDSIEYSLYRDGNFWLIVDTAGLRKTGDIIEQQGIEKSFEQAALADIILLVIDSTKTLNSQEHETYDKIMTSYNDKIITVLTKQDLCNEETMNTALKELTDNAHNSPLYVSAKNKAGIESLEQTIDAKIQSLFAEFKSPYLLNQRQYNLVCKIDEQLQTIASRFGNHVDYELVAYHIREMLEKISELTGKNITEGMLDTIFKTFCVGK